MKTTQKAQGPLSQSEMSKQPAYTSSLLTKSQQMAKPQPQIDKLSHPRNLSPKPNYNLDQQQNSPFISSELVGDFQKLDNKELNNLLQQVSNKASSKIQVQATQFNLKNNLPLVVFLQSIEIERLLGEVESWKYKYIDLDRRISFRAGLEEQIRKEQDEKVQMQVACQQKISLWADEIKKYKALNEKSQLEYQQLLRRFELVSEEWKEKMKDFEAECNRQMKDKITDLQKKIDLSEKKLQASLHDNDELKQQNIIQKNQLINEFELQKQQMQGVFNNQVDSLNGEINRLRGLLELADKERLELERKLVDSNVHKKQLKEAKESIKELNEKLQKLAEIIQATSDENKQLKNSNDELTYQAKILGQKINDLSNILNSLKNENSKKDEEIAEFENDNSSLKILNEDLKSKLSESLRYIELFKDLEKKNQLLISENNALKNELQQALNRLKQLDGSDDKINHQKQRINELEQLLIDKENQIEELTNELKKLTKQFNQLQAKYESAAQQYNEIEQKYNFKYKQCEQLVQEVGKWQKKYELIKVQIEGFKELDVIAQEYDQKLAEIPKAITKVIDDFCYRKTGEMESWRNKYTDELQKVLNSQEAKDLQNLDSPQMTAQSLSASFDHKMRFTSKF